MSYDRDSDLPWGYWLRAVPGTSNVTLIDEDGREWSSVRAAFWHGRCGFAERGDHGRGNHDRDAHLEPLLLLLNADVQDSARSRSIDMDLSKEETHYFPLVREWILTSGLIDERPGGGWVPTAEGRAVARMLIATRSPALPAIHPRVEAVHARRHLGDKEIDRVSFQRREAGRNMTFAFTRETVVNRPAVSLLFRDIDAPLPLIRTLWVQTFADDASRDAFYGWLDLHIDRWHAWGARANKAGAYALTHHLVSIIATELMPLRNIDASPGSAIEYLS
jgi:hypothetical protein